MRVGQGIPPCCPFYSAGLTYPRRYLGFFHQHGWGLVCQTMCLLVTGSFPDKAQHPLSPEKVGGLASLSLHGDTEHEDHGVRVPP